MNLSMLELPDFVEVQIILPIDRPEGVRPEYRGRVRTVPTFGNPIPTLQDALRYAYQHSGVSPQRFKLRFAESDLAVILAHRDIVERFETVRERCTSLLPSRIGQQTVCGLPARHPVHQPGTFEVIGHAFSHPEDDLALLRQLFDVGAIETF